MYYIGERRTTFAKAYGIKVRCYGEHVGEHSGNLMRIHWELEGKIMRTHWEPGNNEKKLLPLPTEKGTKNKALECMLGPSHLAA
jgi:hypothetical protein